MSPGARLRIAAGSLKGRPIQVPPGARPTEGRLREALFSIWSARIEGARFLDLFAGSGAVGIEALSRGALEALFVEADRRAARTLLRNLERVELNAGAQVLCEPTLSALERLALRSERFELVFADPPYGQALPAGFLAAVRRVLAQDGAFALERPAGSPQPSEVEGLVRVDQRRYGGSVLLLYVAG